MADNTILVVEDDENTSHLLQAILESEGYTVRMALDGNEASQIIEEIRPPFCVVLDIMLPFKSGRELLSQIRKKNDWQTVPVLMLSALSSEQEIVNALKNGANDYLLKPFGPGELVARIHRFQT